MRLNESVKHGSQDELLLADLDIWDIVCLNHVADGLLADLEHLRHLRDGVGDWLHCRF